jgi:sec-independent protein translocase protein TatC
LYVIPKDADPLLPLPQGVIPQDSRHYFIPAGSHLDIRLSSGPNSLLIFGPTEGFIITLKVCFWCGLAGTSPFWIACLLQFISPGLRYSEKRFILPFIFHTFNASIGVNLWSLSNYLSYTVLILLANGIAFQSFVVLLFLIHAGWISAATMRSKRRHAILAAFVLGAILTPPDVPSQLMLAFPLIALYETAILYASLRAMIHRPVTQEIAGLAN